jgi:hypothetical protein
VLDRPDRTLTEERLQVDAQTRLDGRARRKLATRALKVLEVAPADLADRQRL